MPTSPPEWLQPDKTQLDETIENLQSKYGQDFVSQGAIAPLRSISTGNLFIDSLTGVQGIPRGRITELFGNESSGKTTLALQAIAVAQTEGSQAAYLDIEHTFNHSQAQELGVDTNALILSHPNSAEQALDGLIQLIRSKALAIVVLDSVAALTTKKERDETDSDKMSLPSLLSEKLKIVSDEATQTDTAVVFINQLRVSKEAFGRTGENSPGGRALKHFASIRMKVIKKAEITLDGTIIGNKTKLTVVKNKLAKPFTSLETDLIFGDGLRHEEPHLFDWALEQGIIEKNGSWYFLPHNPNSVSFDHAIENDALGQGTWSFLKDRITGRDDRELVDKTAGGDQSKIQLGKGKSHAIESLQEIEGAFKQIREIYQQAN